ncbi:MAG TPA: substrate-binding domain-containing protein [Phycisphaerae bacterium]|nr:substrate-binding domain-containing protein [Phycisphaerae bacterium]
MPAGCDNGEGEGGPTAKEPVRIAVVGEGRNEPTWPVIQAAARWFDDRYRLADVETFAPEVISPGEQRKLLVDLANKPFDAVCVVPCDPDAVRVSIQELVRHGKRVITIGRDVPQSDRHANCGPSNFDIGHAAAQACALVLKGRPPTIMLLYAGLEDDAYAARYYAFKDELPLLGGLEVLREVDCAGKLVDAAHLVRVEARRYPRAGCWVFLDDWPLKTIPDDERLLPLGSGIVLCNGSPRYLSRLRDGQILAMITYDFRRAMEEGLLAASKKTMDIGDMPDVSYTLPTEIVTVRELESYEQRWKLWERPDNSAESAHQQASTRRAEKIPNPSSRPWSTSSPRAEKKRSKGP